MGIVGYSLLLICTAMVSVASGYYAAKRGWTVEVKALEEYIEEKNSALEAANVDARLIRALREGEIGIDDLHEIGLEGVQQEATGALALRGETDVELAVEANYMPFVKLPYERACTRIDQMVVGDEVWVSMGSVKHDTDGRPRLRGNVECSAIPTSAKRHRVRYYDGKHELGVDPTDTRHASPYITTEGYWMDYTVILKPRDRWDKTESA